MKKITCLLPLVLLFFCTTQKSRTESKNSTIEFAFGNELTETEREIINDFIDIELKKERYNNYRNFETVIIEEALKKIKPISVYEFNLNHKESWGKFIDNWILDSLQVKQIKRELETEEIYHWKTTDFKNIKANLLKYDELIKTIRTNEYRTNCIIIYLSRPLLIDKKNALISFEIGNGNFGFGGITHFTVLMRKINKKWKQSHHYEDGVYD